MYITDFEFTGKVQSIVLDPGEYLLECWGASGGGREFVSPSLYNENGMGLAGRGGYSRGKISISSSIKMYVYVGGMGANPISTTKTYLLGGFNGGGSSWYVNTGAPGSSGGGATDMKVANNDLHSRIIVAGGGGGGGDDFPDNGGFGGGLTGGQGSGSNSASSGNQDGTYPTGKGGIFGQGAHSNRIGGGQGGGWYGGSAFDGQPTPYQSSTGTELALDGGSGGSGYVFNESTQIYYPEPKPDSDYLLTDSDTIAGNADFKAPNGTITKGNLGNGYARITTLQLFNTIEIDGVIYGKLNDHGSVISYNSDLCNSDIVIKSFVSDFKVIKIAQKAFINNLCLQKVVIPNSIIYILDSAFFGCENLEKVIISSKSQLSFIDMLSFSRTKISNISLPYSISTINSLAFSDSQYLENVSTCSIAYIQQNDVFASCPKLSNIFVSEFYLYSTFCWIHVDKVLTICPMFSIQNICMQNCTNAAKDPIDAKYFITLLITSRR